MKKNVSKGITFGFIIVLIFACSPGLVFADKPAEHPEEDAFVTETGAAIAVVSGNPEGVQAGRIITRHENTNGHDPVIYTGESSSLTKSEAPVVTPGSIRIVFHRNYDAEDLSQTALEHRLENDLLTAGALGWAREGYRFIGWSEKRGEKTPYTPPEHISGTAIELYGIWEEEPQEDPYDNPDISDISLEPGGGPDLPGILVPKPKPEPKPKPDEDDDKKNTGQNTGNNSSSVTNSEKTSASSTGNSNAANESGLNSVEPAQPSDQNTHTITEGEAPLAGGPDGVGEETNYKPVVDRQFGAWSLFNLVLTAISLIMTFIIIIRWYLRRRAAQGMPWIGKTEIAGAISVLGTTAAIILFILTQNMGLSMEMSDHYTPVMLGIAALQFVLMYLSEMGREQENTRDIH